MKLLHTVKSFAISVGSKRAFLIEFNSVSFELFAAGELGNGLGSFADSVLS